MSSGFVLSTPNRFRPCGGNGYVGEVSILTWNLTLSVRQQWAMQEPRHVEWTTEIPRFFCVFFRTGKDYELVQEEHIV